MGFPCSLFYQQACTVLVYILNNELARKNSILQSAIPAPRSQKSMVPYILLLIALFSLNLLPYLLIVKTGLLAILITFSDTEPRSISSMFVFP